MNKKYQKPLFPPKKPFLNYLQPAKPISVDSIQIRMVAKL
jgi:hypothetical protein